VGIVKNRIVTLALIAPLVIQPAFAQESPPPQESQGVAVESVIVTAPKDRPEKRIDDFIIAHAAPSPYLQKIARWNVGICPATVGLSPRLNLYISQRIIRVAMAAGAPLDTHETCRPNILVAATPQPQDLLDVVRTTRPALLGFHYAARSKDVATMRRAVQAWYSTATEDFYGFVTPDGGGYNLNNLDALKAQGFLSMHVSGARTGDGLRSQFTTAIILVDSSKIAGQAIGPLADYVAMLALAQGQYYDLCQPVPTITNLLAPKCEGVRRPTALTDIDMTYLHGLYGMAQGGTYMGERGSIAFAMKKDLGGY